MLRAALSVRLSVCLPRSESRSTIDIARLAGNRLSGDGSESRHLAIGATASKPIPLSKILQVPVSPTCFPDRCQPPEAGPIVRNIKHRSGILLPVCCRHAGFSRKSSSRTSTSANFTWDPSCTPATASKPTVLSMILRVESW